MYIYTFRYWKLRSELQCWLDVKENLFSFQVSSHIIKNKTSRDGMLIQRISTVLYKNTTLTFMWKKKHTGEHKGKHHILIIVCLSFTLCTFYTRKSNKTLIRYTMPNTQKWIIHFENLEYKRYYILEIYNYKILNILSFK